MMSERIQLRSYPYDDSAGRWRLTDHVVEYSKPWEALSSAAIFEEYKRSEFPWKDYVRHLLQRFEGEVALTWEHWTWELKPLPRDAQFWCRQFATNEASSKALGNLTFERDGFGNFMVHHSIDLERVGNTTILRTEQGEKGHWHLSGGVITLAELLFKFGRHYTVSELMNYWYNAKKIFRKEQHAWGSSDCRKSALQRWRSNGPPGHQSHDIDTSRPASNRPSAI